MGEKNYSTPARPPISAVGRGFTTAETRAKAGQTSGGEKSSKAEAAEVADLHVRLPPDVAAWVRARALEEDRSLQAQVAHILKKVMRESMG